MKKFIITVIKMTFCCGLFCTVLSGAAWAGDENLADVAAKGMLAQQDTAAHEGMNMKQANRGVNSVAHLNRDLDPVDPCGGGFVLCLKKS